MRKLEGAMCTPSRGVCKHFADRSPGKRPGAVGLGEDKRAATMTDTVVMTTRTTPTTTTTTTTTTATTLLVVVVVSLVVVLLLLLLVMLLVMLLLMTTAVVTMDGVGMLPGMLDDEGETGVDDGARWGC